MAAPGFQLGRAMTSLVVTPLTVSSTGTIATTTPIATLTGTLETFDYTSTNELEEISAVTARNQNNMIVSTGTECTIEVLMKAGSDAAFAVNAIGAIANGADYAQVVLVQYGMNWSFQGVIKSFNHGIKGKGKVSGTLVVAMIDNGSANPAVS